LCLQLKELQRNSTLRDGLILLLHHVVKGPKKRDEKISLMDDPESYIDLVRGSGRLADFCPIRLAIAKETVAGNELYVVNGIVRSAPVSRLVLDFDEETLSFQPLDDGDLRTQTVFAGTPRQQELYDLLPEEFTFSDVQKLNDNGSKTFSKGTIAATLRKAVDNSLLSKEEDGSYRRIGKSENG